MLKFRVTCKEKHSLYERIVSIGCINTANGSSQRFLEDDAIKLILDGAAIFYDEDAKGDVALVKVDERDGRKFLTTERDGIKDDNLLSLPDCPPKKPQPSVPIRSVIAAGSHAVPFAPYWGA